MAIKNPLLFYTAMDNSKRPIWLDKHDDFSIILTVILHSYVIHYLTV